jgi:CHAT domain-containing protein
MSSDDPARKELLANLLEFATAPTLAESARVLQRHPELLSDGIAALLSRIKEGFRAQGNDRELRKIEELEARLRRCQESAAAGISEDEYSGPQAIHALVQELVNAPTRAVERQIVERHPELLSDFAAEVLAFLIRTNPQAETVLRELHALLRRCREVGVDQAFAERGPGTAAPALPPHPAVFDADLNRIGTGQQAYSSTGDPRALDEALRAWERIAGHADFARTNPEFRMLVFNDGVVLLLSLHRHAGGDARLDQAVSLARQAVTLCPPDSRSRPLVLNNLSQALSARHDRGSDLTDLTDALAAAEEAGELTPAGSPDRAMLRNNQGNLLRKLYALTGKPDDLDRTLRVYEEALAATPPDAPRRPIRLMNLSAGLCDRHRDRGDPQDLERAIALLKEAARLAPSGFPGMGMLLNNLGNALRDRYLHAGVPADLDEAIRTLAAAVGQTEAGAPERPRYLNTLALGLQTRYEQAGAAQDLDQAVKISQQAVALTPAGSPELPRHLVGLGEVLNNRYQQQGDVADLDRATEACEDAERLEPRESPELPQRQCSLASMLLSRYECRGDPDDLERAIALGERALSRLSPPAAGYARCAELLGVMLILRYDTHGDPDDLKRGLELFDRAATGTAPGSPFHGKLAQNRGYGLAKRYEYGGESADLEEAIRVAERLVSDTPAGSPSQAGYLNDLGSYLRRRYELGGKQGDLDAAIGAMQQARASCLPNSALDRICLNNLTAALYIRYQRTGDLADVERGISFARQVLHGLGANSPERPVILTNLSNCLSEHYRHTRNRTGLDWIVQADEEALAITPFASPRRATFLHNLGASLRLRYKETGNLADLERALQLYDQAVAAVGPKSPVGPPHLLNRGNALVDLSERTGDLATLDEAIQTMRQAVQEKPDDAPDLPGWLANLGRGLYQRYRRTATDEDRQELIRVWRKAAQRGVNRSAEAGLSSARTWGEWALQRQAWDEAVEAFDYACQACEQLVRIQLVRRSKEAWLRESQGLAAQAAYARARAGDALGAVVTLEQGQARLLAEVLQRDHADLDRLQVSHPELFERYRRAAERLARLAESEVRAGTLPDGASLADEACARRRDLDAVAAEIRQVPGHATFLTPRTLNDVRAALGPEPGARGVVYLATAAPGSLALVVTQDAVHAELLELCEGELNDFLVRSAGGVVTGGYLPAQSDGQALEEILAEGLPLLGERLMSPVAEYLRSVEVKEVALVPAGRLALLPLHAARYLVAGRTTYFLDEFVVSYAPNALALETARRGARQRTGGPGHLVGVGNPLPHPRPLPGAEAELEEVAGLFPEPGRHVLVRDAARRDAVLPLLATGTHLHFACHGLFDPGEPLASRLELAAGDTLTLRDLLDGGARPERAGLAVLSACQTALSDFRNLPDEFLGLPAGFLQAGVPGVVGTLWPVLDIATALLMVKFYQLHLRGDAATHGPPLSPARALGQAQRWLRDVTNGELARYYLAQHELNVALETKAARMAVETVLAGLARFGLGEEADRPFADRPYCWAAVVYVGA